MSLERTKDSFHDVLESISEHARFFSCAMAIRKRSAEIIPFNGLNPQDTPAVESFRRAGIENGQPVFESLYVSICFHLEEFVRDLHKVAVEEIVRRCPKVEDVKKELLNNHVVATGQILFRYLADARASKVDVNLYARNVASCVPGGANYTLNAEAFTLFFSGAGVEDLERLFKRIGFEINWDDLGRSAELRQFFQGGRAREVGKHAKMFLDDFVSERNVIVHRGVGVRDVPEAKIHSAVEFFKMFSSELVSVIGKFCKEYR